MSYRDGEYISIPFRGGESGPCVRGIRRRMGPPIQVNRTIDRAQPLGMESRDFARERVDFFPDTKVRRTAPDIVGGVRSALPLRQGLDGSIPGIAAHAPGFVDRNAEVIAKL